MGRLGSGIAGHCTNRIALFGIRIRSRALPENIGDLTEIFANYSGESPALIRGLFENQNGYATPKVDVRGVVFRDDKLLMVQERSDGLWTLPGGWADVNDSPSEAVEREIVEESGFRYLF